VLTWYRVTTVVAQSVKHLHDGDVDLPNAFGLRSMGFICIPLTWRRSYEHHTGIHPNRKFHCSLSVHPSSINDDSELAPESQGVLS
jgi:hypothetical protein